MTVDNTTTGKCASGRRSQKQIPCEFTRFTNKGLQSSSATASLKSLQPDSPVKEECLQRVHQNPEYQ